MLQTAALILAAGKGTRMHSDKPKVLQTVLGEPMLRYVLEAVRPVFDGRVLVVVGHQAGMVEAAFPDASFVHQEQQLGTGHALMQAMPALEGQCERVLVVNGDTPLLSEDVVRHFVEASEGADLAFATIELDDPAAYGRVVRAADGSVRAIVEAKDYDPALYGPEPHEVNAGMYCVRLDLAARLLPGAVLEEASHVGNFVELKKSRLGKGAKANHLTYLGDSEIGAGTNIGAGTITCNYDGKHKFKTTIGEGAFIGSNTALVAPVRVGDGALIGAGSVITKDVPDGEMGIARGRQKNLPRKSV